MPHYLKVARHTVIKTNLVHKDVISDALIQELGPETRRMRLLGLIKDLHPDYLKFTLADGKFIKGRNTWWALKADVEIIEEQVRSPEVEVISDLKRNRRERGPKIHIPGIGLVHLYDTVGDSKDFYVYELTRNGERIPPTAEGGEGLVRIAEALQIARDRIGEPFIITSGYRPKHINDAIGGARFSRHTDPSADAIDFYWGTASKFEMYDALDPWWSGGLGIYGHNNILHADARGYRARWGR